MMKKRFNGLSDWVSGKQSFHVISKYNWSAVKLGGIFKPDFNKILGQVKVTMDLTFSDITKEPLIENGRCQLSLTDAGWAKIAKWLQAEGLKVVPGEENIADPESKKINQQLMLVVGLPERSF